MPEPQRLRRGLLRNPGDDRVMAQTLAIVLSGRIGRVGGGYRADIGDWSTGQGQCVVRGQCAGPSQRAADDGNPGHAAEGDNSATGEHGTLRQPALGNVDNTVGVTTEGAGNED